MGRRREGRKGGQVGLAGRLRLGLRPGKMCQKCFGKALPEKMHMHGKQNVGEGKVQEGNGQ